LNNSEQTVFPKGTDWQIHVLGIGGHAVFENAPLLRVLVPRATRDGEAAELHKIAIPLFVSFFEFAGAIIRIRGTELEEALGTIVDTAFMAITAAFDVPEIIEAIINTLIELAQQDGLRMASDPRCIWIPLSIILTPEFSPFDKKWNFIILALIRYHQALAAAQPDHFWATFEGAVGQFMDPAQIVSVYRDALLLAPAADAQTHVITPVRAQVYVELHVRALSYTWAVS
jgi:hypothetical protein